MTISAHFFLECNHPECRFRFPASGHKPAVCPRCHEGALTSVDIQPCPVEEIASIPPSPFCGALLDNIRSTFNVGSMFRTADGLLLEHLYLTGISATPEHPKLAKTALGAQNSLKWSHHPNGMELGRRLVAEGYQLWALEGGVNAASLFDVQTLPAEPRIILVAGNEITGIDPAILDLCSAVKFIPMQGTKGSLNVAVAFGIAAYHLRLAVSVR